MTVQLQIQEILNRVFDAVNNRLRVAAPSRPFKQPTTTSTPTHTPSGSSARPMALA
jgi:hypothetical protein